MKVWQGVGRADGRDLARQRRRQKYGSQRCQHDDHWHQSERERDRCFVLQQRERLGEIHQLTRQKPYDLAINGVHITRYVADFVYIQGNQCIVEDAKGYRTPEYRIKRQLMKALYNVEILET